MNIFHTEPADAVAESVDFRAVLGDHRCPDRPGVGSLHLHLRPAPLYEDHPQDGY